jgi:hypothetical protein
MKNEVYKFLTKAQLERANKRAIKAGCNAIEPTYVDQLPDGVRFPIFFCLPWERHGWVRCQIGTAQDKVGHDYIPVWLDVPNDIYDDLASVNVTEVEEVTP